MKASSLFPCLSVCLLLAISGCTDRKSASTPPLSSTVSEAPSASLSPMDPASIPARSEQNPTAEIHSSENSARTVTAFQTEEAPEEMESMETDASEQADAFKQAEGLSWKDGILIINKKHGVPADWAPGVDPSAQSHVNDLIERMRREGLSVSFTTSSYRSFDYQKELYERYVRQYGQEAADTFSARPGFSEHQSGLAFDLLDGSGQLLTAPQEAQWLLDHSWEYGFIVRYPAGKESVTGYQAEPWHLRYIGERAEEIARSGLTLEEFLGVEGGAYSQ